MSTTINNEKMANVPDKYNGYQLDYLKKYALFMDYININYEGLPDFSHENIKANFEDYGTKVFEKIVKIVYKGNSFGTLVFKPRSKIIDENLCQFKLENHLFYTLPLSEIYNQLDELTSLMCLEYKNINRLDVALDFNESEHDVTKILQKICTNDLLISGREKDINIYSQTKKGKMTFQGIRIGSRSSSRFLRVYDKTEESKKNIKTYILDMWATMGLKNEDTNHVWRYEYQLNSNFLRELEGLTLQQIFTNQGLFNLLKTANSNHFELKINTGKTETNKEKSFTFICWTAVAKCLKLVKKVITKIRRNIKETLIGQQRLCKALLRSYCSSGQRLEYILPMKLMLSDFDLWSWFGKKLPYYIDEFKKKEIIKKFDSSLFQQDLTVEI